MLLTLLLACTSPSDGPDAAPRPPPPGVLTLAVGPVLPGRSLTLSSAGAPAGQAVTFLFGDAGPGACPPALGGACLGITNHRVLGTARADAAGAARLSFRAPATLPDGQVGWFQAGYLTAGAAALSRATSRTVGLDDPDLLLTELVVTPTEGEMIEVHNPGSTPADLSNVWLADYATAWGLPLGQGAPTSSDLRVRFPDGATLPPGGYVTVALGSATEFASVHGVLPDYDLDAADAAAPTMVGSFTASSSLTNGDEMVHLFRWDGGSDAVVDLDYVVYGNTSDGMDRTGQTTGAHAWLPDTPIAAQDPAPTHAAGESLQRCNTTETGQGSGGNGFGGSDETSERLGDTWVARTATSPGAGSDCSELPLGVLPLDLLELPPAFVHTPGVYITRSAAELQALVGGPIPSLDWSIQIVIFYTMGPQPFPGTVPQVTGVSQVGDTLRVYTEEHAPGPGCTTLGYQAPAWTAVIVERPTAPFTTAEVAGTSLPFDCAADGLPEDFGCDPLQLCGVGLLCHALTIEDAGWCRDAVDHRTFHVPANLDIPDDGSTVTSPLTVSGLATVPEDVIVTLHIDHPDPSQLRVVLTNLYGTPSLVWDRWQASGGLHITRPVGFAGDESANGPWNLEVTDHVPGGVGRLVSWDVEMTSRYD